jgi:uncharacterized protein
MTMESLDDVRFESGRLTLAGTLHRPAGPGPHPALVMLQGSGEADRDSGGYFPPIRDHFVENGIAVFSWDKPGIGGSSGDWRQRDLFDRATEAIDAVRCLRDQSGIDPARVGIWGHSQGGWVGPLAASQTPDLTFLVVNSGPGITVHAQNLYGIEHTLRRDGASEPEIVDAIAFMNAVDDAAMNARPYDEVVATILEPARGTPGETYFGEIDADLWRFFVRILSRPYDPAATLERITCPTLALFGERDVLVPAANCVPIFEAAFEKSGNSDLTIIVFPGADHRIRLGDPPDFAPGYLEAMSSWIRQRVGLD